MVFNGVEFNYSLYFEPTQPLHCVLVFFWPIRHTQRESHTSVPDTAAQLTPDSDSTF